MRCRKRHIQCLTNVAVGNLCHSGNSYIDLIHYLLADKVVIIPAAHKGRRYYNFIRTSNVCSRQKKMYPEGKYIRINTKYN